jgi:hypothetical protein
MSVFLYLKFGVVKGRRFTLHKNRAAPATNLIADFMSVFLYLKFSILAIAIGTLFTKTGRLPQSPLPNYNSLIYIDFHFMGFPCFQNKKT